MTVPPNGAGSAGAVARRSDPGAFRRHALSVATILSVVTAVVLACGYAGRFGLSLGRWTAARPSPTYWDVQPLVDGGRVVCYVTLRSAFPPALHVTPPPPGLHVRFGGRFDLQRFDARRALWNADAHVLSATPWSSTYILAAPIWCLEVPCVIAPLLWFRQRRRSRPESRGFTVVASDR